MRFENFFCTSPVCSPARASLLTGRIPSQHGVHDWIKEGNVGRGCIEYLEGQTGYTDLLHREGYSCAISGKWHLGDSLKPQKSFDRWYVHQGGGGPYYHAPMVRDGRPVEEEGYITDLITEEALRFLEDHSPTASPFYLSVHYTAPHYPWLDNHPEELVQFYDDCPFESCPQEPDHAWIGPYDLLQEIRPKARENLQGYFAAVTAMDAGVGRILDHLDKQGLRNRTLVCFMSDNGFNCGHHGIWGKGNGTFPLNMYETSVKVPAIFSQPGRIPAGRVSDQLLSGYDFMPTLLEYTGLPYEPDPSLPGSSFVSLLTGGDAGAREEQVVVYSEYGPTRMLRNEQWKYVHRFPYGPHELYDLVHDPQERKNLVEETKHRALIRELRCRLDAWFLQYVDPAMDGAREAVTGHGQIGPAGRKAHGREAFEPVREQEF
jgi:arylsulfatase A-like enzyme